MIGELDRKTWEPKKMIMTGHLKRQIARDLRIKPSTPQFHNEYFSHQHLHFLIHFYTPFLRYKYYSLIILVHFHQFQSEPTVL